jgi:hypothetical protein
MSEIPGLILVGAARQTRFCPTGGTALWRADEPFQLRGAAYPCRRDRQQSCLNADGEVGPSAPKSGLGGRGPFPADRERALKWPEVSLGTAPRR